MTQLEPPPGWCPDFDPDRPSYRPAACDICGCQLDADEPWCMCRWCDGFFHEACHPEHECMALYLLLKQAITEAVREVEEDEHGKA